MLDGGGDLPRCAALQHCVPYPDHRTPCPHTRLLHFCLQISAAELSSAMSFLREQMGEEELRQMLHMLSEEAGAVYV